MGVKPAQVHKVFLDVAMQENYVLTCTNFAKDDSRIGSFGWTSVLPFSKQKQREICGKQGTEVSSGSQNVTRDQVTVWRLGVKN